MIQAEVRRWSGSEEFTAAFQAKSGSKHETFEARLDMITSELSEFLKKNGLPYPLETCVYSGAYWCSMPDDWDDKDIISRCASIKSANVGLGVDYINRKFERTDPESIAADICLRIFEYKRLNAEKKPEAAFQIGRLTQLLSSLSHLSIVERGKKNKAATVSGGKSTGKKIRDERKISESIAYMMELLKQNLTISDAAEKTAKKFGIMPSAMRTRYYNAKKSGRA